MDGRETAAVLEASRLLARLAQSIDLGDADAIAELFVPDGVLEGLLSGKTLEGRDAIREFFAERELARDQSLARRRHHVATINARLDGDVVRSTSYFNVIGPGGTVAGVYNDELVETDDGWRIKRKTINVEYRGE